MRNRKLSIALMLDIRTACNQARIIGIFRHLRTLNTVWETSILPGPSAPGGFDGCIADEWHAAEAAQLAAAKVPTVAIDIDAKIFPAAARVAHIKVNNREIAEKALAHFDAMGRFNAYLYVRDPLLNEWSAIRETAFRKLVTRRKKRFFVLPHPATDDGVALTKRLASAPKPLAVFCANDKCASDVLNVCRDAHLDVPGQVALLGVDNDVFLCSYCKPTLSSIAPDFEQEGFVAARELDRLLRNPRAAVWKPKFVPNKEVIVRASTRTDTSPSSLVQIGIDFILANFDQRISVFSVTRAMGTSRRLAELRFRQLKGTSIGAFILSTRIAQVQRLLKTTNLPIAEIAGNCGFANASYMTRSFKRITGLTPTEWRHSTNIS